MSEKEQKTAENKRRKKKGNIDDDEPDMDALDWWSKYFASVETMIRVRHFLSVRVTCSHFLSARVTCASLPVFLRDLHVTFCLIVLAVRHFLSFV